MVAATITHPSTLESPKYRQPFYACWQTLMTSTVFQVLRMLFQRERLSLGLSLRLPLLSAESCCGLLSAITLSRTHCWQSTRQIARETIPEYGSKSSWGRGQDCLLCRFSGWVRLSRWGWKNLRRCRHKKCVVFAFLKRWKHNNMRTYSPVLIWFSVWSVTMHGHTIYLQYLRLIFVIGHPFLQSANATETSPFKISPFKT